MTILWTILIGFIAGVLAKLITPGSNERLHPHNNFWASSARSLPLTWDKRLAGTEPMRVRVSPGRRSGP